MFELSQSTYSGVSFLKKSCSDQNSSDMIDNKFKDFPKIDQVQVPAANETINKI